MAGIFRDFIERAEMKKVIDATGVTFTFTDLPAVRIEVADLSAENRAYGLLHGLAAKVGDTAAIPKSAENSFTVTEKMRRDAVLEMVDFLGDSANVNWDMKKTRVAAFNPVMQAIAEKRGISYAEAQVWYNEKMIADLAAM